MAEPQDRAGDDREFSSTEGEFRFEPIIVGPAESGPLDGGVVLPPRPPAPVAEQAPGGGDVLGMQWQDVKWIEPTFEPDLAAGDFAEAAESAVEDQPALSEAPAPLLPAEPEPLAQAAELDDPGAAAPLITNAEAETVVDGSPAEVASAPQLSEAEPWAAPSGTPETSRAVVDSAEPREPEHRAAPTVGPAESTAPAEPVSESAEPVLESAEPVLESAEPVLESAEPALESIASTADEPVAEDPAEIAPADGVTEDLSEPEAEIVVARSVLRTEIEPRATGWRPAAVAAALIAAAVLGVGTYYFGGLAGVFGGAHKPVITLDRTASKQPLAPPQSSAAAPSAAGPPTDPVQRAAYFLALAKTGDPAAQQDLGVMYAQGDGLTRDYASAAAWFREAAINGIVNAQYNLAVLYERGLGVPKNLSEALIWYHSAADRNHPAAQYNLALAYAEGRGTPQNFVEAARWYHRAAEQGVVPAMVNFAILYERGQGVDASPLDAYAWYRAAAQRGDTVAEKRAGELYEQFSDKDKGRAEALANTVAAAIHDPVPESPTKPAAASQGGPDPVLKSGNLGRHSEAEPIGLDRGPPQTVEVAPTSRAITEIQRRLALAEAHSGAIDGITGRETIQAIRHYQEAHGLQVDGNATLALLNYLRSTAAPPSPAARR